MRARTVKAPIVIIHKPTSIRKNHPEEEREKKRVNRNRLKIEKKKKKS